MDRATCPPGCGPAGWELISLRAHFHASTDTLLLALFSTQRLPAPSASGHAHHHQAQADGSSRSLGTGGAIRAALNPKITHLMVMWAIWHRRQLVAVLQSWQPLSTPLNLLLETDTHPCPNQRPGSSGAVPNSATVSHVAGMAEHLFPLQQQQALFCVFPGSNLSVC